MKYTEFVKANYSKVADLPAKQRMAKLGQMWKASGHSSGKGVAGGDVAGGMFIKRKGGKRGKKAVGKAKGKGLFSMAKDYVRGRGVAGGEVAGGGILSGPLSIFGLGVEPKSKKGKMRKVRGKGIISDTLGAIGLGMSEGAGVKKRGRKPKGGSVVGGADEKGSGIVSGFLDSIGLGMPEGAGVKKRGRKPKGGSVVGGADEKGSGIVSGFLDSIGLGMPDKIKKVHYNRMMALEKKLHSQGKLTPALHNKLKVYHTLHGAGFFDSLFSAVKKGASAVASVIPHAINNIGTIAKVIPQVSKYVPEVAKYIPAVGKLAGPLAKIAPLAAMV
jgi:hypothetical protein